MKVSPITVCAHVAFLKQNEHTCTYLTIAQLILMLLPPFHTQISVAENTQAFSRSREEKFMRGFFRQMHEICTNFA